MGQRRDTRAEVQELTEQFYVTLRAYVARLTPQDQARSPRSFQQVQELLEREDGELWSHAYEIEQLLVDLYDDRTLDIELHTRMLEAESNLRPAVTQQYVKLAGAATTSAERRAVLARLVNDLQWRYTVNEVKRSYSNAITATTGRIFTGVMVIFAMTAIWRLVQSSGPDAGGGWPLLVLAALAGAWGAGFSMLSGLKARLDAADLNDLKLMRGRWLLFSRPLIGVGAAAILYFFIASGLLGGTAFPQLAAPMTDAPKQFALLIVWCFIAGFSERLVPALLAKTEERATAQSERYKPSGADVAAPPLMKKVEPPSGEIGNGAPAV